MAKNLMQGVLQGFLGLVLTVPCVAQTSSLAPQNQPQAASPSPQTLPSSDVTVSPGVTTSPVTPSVLPGSSKSSSVGKSFGTAGQGLPGMPGGPPIRETAGAQDPSSAYMRPPVIGPLFCDPAIDIPCR